MIRVDRQSDVDGQEQGEDVGLEERHQDLERREEHHGEGRQRQEDGVPLGGEQAGGERGEGDQEHVPGQQVGEETHHQGEGAHQEGVFAGGTGLSLQRGGLPPLPCAQQCGRNGSFCQFY